MIIDSHCHLSFPQLGNHSEETKKYLVEAKNSNIGIIVNIATDVNMFDTCSKFSRELNSNKDNIYPKILYALGVHPLHINENLNFKAEDFIPYIQEDNLVAIGETGFDGYYSTDNFEIQKKLFNIHAIVATKHQLPIIIHSRSAANQTTEALSYYVKNHNLVGVIHCFTGDIDLAKKFLNLGFYLSFSGILTYKNAKEVQDVARFAPLDRILIETDAPYLTPVPLRSKESKINKPEYVKYTFEYLLSLRKENSKKVEETIENNFFNLFTKAKRD